jgi:hypothetical protein
VEHLPPEQVALLLSVGLVLGLFPIAGCPTVLCLLAALGLRVKFAALQLVNQISSPLQLAVALPLARAGAWLCRGGATGGSSMAGKLAAVAVHAIAGWTCICIPAGVLLYFALTFAERKRRRLWSNSVQSPA